MRLPWTAPEGTGSTADLPFVRVDALNVFVTVPENESVDRSLGDGVAQYALSPEPVAEG